jgi:hypothetical protein
LFEKKKRRWRRRKRRDDGDGGKNLYFNLSRKGFSLSPLSFRYEKREEEGERERRNSWRNEGGPGPAS